MADFKKGDLARIVDSYNENFGKDGDIVRIIRDQYTKKSGTYVKYESIDGEKIGVWDAHRFEPYTPAAGDTIKLEGAPYVLADRKAEVGEKVIINGMHDNHIGSVLESVSNGDIFTVEYSCDLIKAGEGAFSKSEYLVLEPKSALEPVPFEPDVSELTELFAEEEAEVPTYTLSQLAGKTLRISVAEDTYEGVTTKVTIARDVEDGAIYVIDVEEDAEVGE